MKKKVLISVLGFLSILVAMAILVFGKFININRSVATKYEVQGIDVSHYQGEIDWQKIAEQEIDFAYIKATEGSSSVDETFVQNWKDASAQSMYVGAYHFFSFDSQGETQAQNYIRAVGDLSGKLIPVVDVEYYGDKEKHPPKKEDVVRELNVMLDALENQYGRKPMLYTTYNVYYKYLKGDFEEYPLWIRNVYFSPNLGLKGKWTLWQYSDTDVLDGYKGEEKYIDRNVFYGTMDEMKELVVDTIG